MSEAANVKEQESMMNQYGWQAQVTGIGSLPHTDAAEAVRFVANYSRAIPFWAQLPKRDADENMLTQMLMPFRDLLAHPKPGQLHILEGEWGEFRRRLRTEEARLYASTAAGFYAFESAVAHGEFWDALALKGQLTGPLTLARCLYYQERPLMLVPEVHADLADYVYRLALWQYRRLGRFGKPVWLYIDEPVFGLEQALSALWEELRYLVAALRQDGVKIGIHCCATPPPATLCDLAPDLVSFDAYRGLEVFLAQPKVCEYVAEGGTLGFGMIPTTETLAPCTVGECFTRWVAAMDDSYPLEELAARSFWTATCGLGLVTHAAAQDSFRRTTELARMLEQISQMAPAA